jgi:membrane-associated phospholipid phosphatase
VNLQVGADLAEAEIRRTEVRGHPPHRRLGAALWTFWMAPWRPRRHKTQRSWTAPMVMLAIGFLLVTAIAAFADEAAIRFVREQSSAILRAAAAITDLGQSGWYLAPAAATILALALVNWSHMQGRWKARLAFVFGQAGFAFAAIAVSGILVNIIKFFVGRGRPRLMDEFGAFHFEPFSISYALNSFPSGHSSTCGALAMVLMLWFPRWWPVSALALGALAFTRVAAQAHYPSDVVMGFGIGLLYTLHLARWLAVRGQVFTIVPGRTLPTLRHARSWRPRLLRKHA